MIKRLRIKFVAVNMAIVTLLLCCILGLVLYFTQANFERESIRMMENIAAQPGRFPSPADLPEDVQLPFFTLQLGPYGELIATGGGYFDLSDQAFLQELIEATLSKPQSLGVLEEYHLRYYRVEKPMQLVLVFADMTSEQASVQGLRRTCLILGGLSFLAFLVVSILLSKWAVDPVAQAMARQRQFVAAASHELKTPLSVIITDAEVLEQAGDDPARRAQSLSGILTMSQQMRRLIEQLLELARADGLRAHAPFAPFSWSQALEETVLPLEPVFFEKGLTLSTEIAGEIFVRGARQQLTEVAEILLDNAQKYARPGGKVWVSLIRSGKRRCLLRVENEGDLIAREDLTRIFQRFYRADAARSQGGSFGLGLAIAREVVSQHRGRIWAESQNGVNRFLVELPTMKA